MGSVFGVNVNHHIAGLDQVVQITMAIAKVFDDAVNQGMPRIDEALKRFSQTNYEIGQMKGEAVRIVQTLDGTIGRATGDIRKQLEQFKDAINPLLVRLLEMSDRDDPKSLLSVSLTTVEGLSATFGEVQKKFDDAFDLLDGTKAFLEFQIHSADQLVRTITYFVFELAACAALLVLCAFLNRPGRKALSCTTLFLLWVTLRISVVAWIDDDANGRNSLSIIAAVLVATVLSPVAFERLPPWSLKSIFVVIIGALVASVVQLWSGNGSLTEYEYCSAANLAEHPYRPSPLFACVDHNWPSTADKPPDVTCQVSALTMGRIAALGDARLTVYVVNGVMGAGKSTFLTMLARYLAPRTGCWQRAAFITSDGMWGGTTTDSHVMIIPTGPNRYALLVDVEGLQDLNISPHAQLKLITFTSLVSDHLFQFCHTKPSDACDALMRLVGTGQSHARKMLGTADVSLPAHASLIITHLQSLSQPFDSTKTLVEMIKQGKMKGFGNTFVSQSLFLWGVHTSKDQKYLNELNSGTSVGLPANLRIADEAKKMHDTTVKMAPTQVKTIRGHQVNSGVLMVKWMKLVTKALVGGSIIETDEFEEFLCDEVRVRAGTMVADAAAKILEQLPVPCDDDVRAKLWNKTLDRLNGLTEGSCVVSPAVANAEIKKHEDYNKIMRAFKWRIGPWGPCTGTCQEAEQHRDIYCVRGDNARVSDGKCEADQFCRGARSLSGTAKQPTSTACTIKEVHLTYTNWGDCELDHDGVYRERRSVTCKDCEKEVPMSSPHCSSLPREALVKQCGKRNPNAVYRVEVHTGRYVDRLKLTDRTGLSCQAGGTGGAGSMLDLEFDDCITSYQMKKGKVVDFIRLSSRKGRSIGGGGGGGGWVDPITAPKDHCLATGSGVLWQNHQNGILCLADVVPHWVPFKV